MAPGIAIARAESGEHLKNRGAVAPSSAESLCGTRLCLGGFFLSILRRRVRVERMEKLSRDRGHLIHCGQKRGLI
jgi:hypothetical protein